MSWTFVAAMEVCLNLKLINQKNFLNSYNFSKCSVISDDFNKLFLLSAEMPKDIYKKYYKSFSRHIGNSTWPPLITNHSFKSSKNKNNQISLAWNFTVEITILLGQILCLNLKNLFKTSNLNWSCLDFFIYPK